ncbi:MAG: glycogen debranching enzyme N-terminal domain-containing protein [Clostridia bacterium]|nr:glycogen debranching enzyme N-terminal domain-containing protein [Clostridia bacterium]MDD4387295.1 glycogen debranching enzyme N-terminal domain-containing protein [Clostridia bacterium]
MYKRGINNLEQFKNMNFYLSSNKSAYLSMGAILDIKKPYNGMYIKSSKIYVSHVVEKIEIGSKSYNIAELSTLTKQLSSEIYLNELDLENNYFEYICNDIKYSKKINFIPKTDILCIEYDIKSSAKQKVVFKVVPYLTYRDMTNMKKSNILKFNKRPIESGILINLSVTDDENIIIKSDYATFFEVDSYLNNIKHEFIDTNLTKELFIEDVYLPGEFEIKVKPGAELSFRVYISCKEFEITNYLNKSLSELVKKDKDNIKVEYVELKKLTSAIKAFELDDMISSIPAKINIKKMVYNLETNDIDKLSIELCNITKAIDGQYLVLNKFDKALEKLELIISYTLQMDKVGVIESIEYVKLKLWIIEIINKIADKNQGLSDLTKDFLRNTILDIRYNMLNNKSDYLKYIEVIALTYNAFKIYEDILDDNTYFEISKEIKETILIKFWNSEFKVLKYNLDDIKLYASPEMIYSLSLSYQSVDGDIPIKLLDTVFKELYTPYGLREVSKNSLNYKGIIYPRYMSHFVKANLRQNGVTYASQKISYNLVKELLLEIGKHSINTVKSIYHEKGINIDSNSIDLLTTAEMIRLYDMLT